MTEDFSDEAFDSVISVNLKGVFNCMKAELKKLKAEGSPGGSIVNAASVAGMRGYPRNVVYCASKVGSCISGPKDLISNPGLACRRRNDQERREGGWLT